MESMFLDQVTPLYRLEFNIIMNGVRENTVLTEVEIESCHM